MATRCTSTFRGVERWGRGSGPGVAPGTYFLQASELHQMSTRNEMDGGMITEIIVN